MSTGNRGNKRLKPNPTPLPNEVVCCLCRTKIDYEKQDPQRFFKHIREVHGLWPKKPEIEMNPCQSLVGVGRLEDHRVFQGVLWSGTHHQTQVRTKIYVIRFD